jgi:uncharacterized protein (TIGR03067 family)
MKGKAGGEVTPRMAECFRQGRGKEICPVVVPGTTGSTTAPFFAAILPNTAATMRTIFRPIAACLALGGFVVISSAHGQLGRPAGEADPKKEILGTWEGYMANPDGSSHGEIRLEITADTITATNPRGDQTMGAGTYKISGATNKMKRIDAKGTSGQFQNKSYEGVFTIEGKTLKWCSANDNPNSKRPNDLKTNMQAGQFLMVLEKK